MVFVVASLYQSLQIVILLLQACLLGSLQRRLAKCRTALWVNIKNASVYTISHAVRTSGEATEDPLKSEFLPSFRCKCWGLNVILCHNCSDYLTNTWWSMKTLKTWVSSPRVDLVPEWRWVHAWKISPTITAGYMQPFPLYILPLYNVCRYANDCASREMQLYASQPIYAANESLKLCDFFWPRVIVYFFAYGSKFVLYSFTGNWRDIVFSFNRILLDRILYFLFLQGTGQMEFI